MTSASDAATAAFFDALHDGVEKTAIPLQPMTRMTLGLGMAGPDDLANLEASAGAFMDGGAGTPVAVASSPEQLPVPPTLEEEAQGDLDRFYGPTPAPGAMDLPPVSALDGDPLPGEVDPDAGVTPTPPGRVSHGKLFNNPQANPLELFSVLSQRYAESWVEWESETLWYAIRKNFGPVGELTRNKIEALKVAVKNDLAWQDWDVFEDCGLAWNGTMPVFGAFQPMTPSQTAYAVHVLRFIRADDEINFEVSAYMAAILDQNGFVFAPEEWFPGVQALLDRNEEVVGLKVEVARAWEAARRVHPSQLSLNPAKQIDLHIAKLILVDDYLKRKIGEISAVAARGRSKLSASPTSPPVP